MSSSKQALIVIWAAVALLLWFCSCAVAPVPPARGGYNPMTNNGWPAVELLDR